MTERRLYLDASHGERRGVVTLDGRPERLLIERDGSPTAQALGARSVARVRKIERASGLAFLELSEGDDAVLNLTPEHGRLVEGQALEVEIRTEARTGKGASVRLVAEAEGRPRLLAPAPSLEESLLHYLPGGDIRTDGVARSVADGAQDDVLQTVFSIPGGGSIAIESTRALTAVDVDLGGRPGGEAKRVARAANFAAIGVAARLLRLKGLGGLVVIDLVGRGHDGPALLSAARQAFGPDNPGVTLGAISRFGALELIVPRRARPAMDILTRDGHVPSVLTQALALVRAIEREAQADGGGRFAGLSSIAVAEAAQPALASLIAILGARVTVRGEDVRQDGSFEVVQA